MSANPTTQPSTPRVAPAIKSDSLPIAIAKTDSTRPVVIKKRKHSPRTATLLGLIPGAGQIYNGKYWKLPLVYGGLVGIGYWAWQTRTIYNGYAKAYLYAVDGDPATTYVYPLDPYATTARLKTNRDRYRKQSETAMFAFIGFYGLVVADAFVDAHLKGFDISDNLTMRIRPTFRNLPNNNWVERPTLYPSLSIQFNTHATTQHAPHQF